MSEIIEKKQITFPEMFKWFWTFWSDLKFRVFVLLVLTPIAVYFNVYIPVFVKEIIDELNKPDISYDLIKGGVRLIFIYGMSHFILHIFVQTLRGVTNVRLENDFRVKTFKYIINLGQNFFQKFSAGDLITRLIDDVSEKKLAWFACSGIFRLYEAILKVCGALFFMFYISPLLTVVAGVPLVFLVMFYKISSNKTISYSMKTQKAISTLNSFLTNTFDGIRIIKSYNREKKLEKSFDEVVQNQLKKEIDLVKVSAVLDLSYSRLSEIAIIFVFLFGGLLVINDSISIGSLIAFNSYMFMLMWPMVDIGQFFVKGRTAGVSVERVRELENFDPDIINDSNPIDFPQGKNDFEFKDINYSFNDGSKGLENISFSVKTGETIALVGGVGSGKSTLIKLLPRIIEPKNGQLLLNDIDNKKYDIENLRKNIGYATQTPMLFSNTIRNNIIFGRENITDEMIQKAVKIAQLEKELDTFTNGIETIIGQRGVKLSGGQKQRVAIARAIVSNPKILVLDDCTSALDAETEELLWQELYKVMPDITVFLITHRVSTLKKIDKIVLLENGSINSVGKHEELIKQSELYQTIYS